MMPTKEAHMAKHKIPTSEDTQQTTEPTIDLQEQIRFRAYELYEQRGGDHGHDLDDWLQAEWELTQQKPEKVAA
jgi:phage terminase Nu1 subunit (DNA packaging protein)